MNVGKRNEVLPLDHAFSADRRPKAYILNRDKEKIEERRKNKPEEEVSR
jgi:hypothetical protein